VVARPPNPLSILSKKEQRARRPCAVITDGVQCEQATIYSDTFREQLLCLEHARRIAQLPEIADQLVAARELAAMSLVGLTNQAIAVLEEILENEDIPASVRLRASTEVMDRVGFVKSENLVIQANQEKPHEVSASDLIAARLAKLAPSAKNVIPINQNEEPSD